MRIVLTSMGTEGDTRPVLALGSEMARAGHDVTVLTDRDAAGLADRLGLDFEPLSGNVRETLRVAGGQSAARALSGLMRREAGTWVRQVDAAARGADVVLGSALTWSPAVAVARGHGALAVGASLQPTEPTRAFTSPLLGPITVPKWANRAVGTAVLAGLRVAGDCSTRPTTRRLGYPQAAPARPDLVLGAWSPELVPTPSDWPHGAVRVTGDWRLDDTTDSADTTDTRDGDGAGHGLHAEGAPAADLVEFMADGPPPVFVGLGSMAAATDIDAFVRHVADELDGRRALLATGWAAAATGSLPAGIMLVQRAPHGWLFPQCHALVHHCGAGTSHAAAHAGVPTIPAPMASDQYFWAERLRRAGAATPRIALRPRHRGQLRQAVQRVDTLQPAARQLAKSMTSSPGVAAARTAIEDLHQARIKGLHGGG